MMSLSFQRLFVIFNFADIFLESNGYITTSIFLVATLCSFTSSKKPLPV